MLWFFERGEERIRLHAAYNNELKEFVATITWSHGREDQIRFASIDALHEWLKSLETNLAEDQWQQDGQPVMLRDGWPDKPLI